MREYLTLPARLQRDVVSTKLGMVELDADDGAKYPAELSGGMVKRVALARALALDPEIVFLDEPTSGLDPIAAGEFDALIKTLQKALGLTVFMVTHDLDSLYAVCDRVAALADGRIVALGTMAEIHASTHPWVKAYFGGVRSRAASTLVTRRNRWKPTPATCSWEASPSRCKASVFGFVFWLDSTGGMGERRIYAVRFEQTVSGLAAGSRRAVRRTAWSGRGLQPEARSEPTPDASSRRSPSPAPQPVRRDTKAGMEYQGLMGTAAVSLQSGASDEALEAARRLSRRGLLDESRKPPVVTLARSRQASEAAVLPTPSTHRSDLLRRPFASGRRRQSPRSPRPLHDAADQPSSRTMVVRPRAQARRLATRDSVQFGIPGGPHALQTKGFSPARALS